MKSRTRWHTVSGVLCAVALLAAACGDGGEEKLSPTPGGTSPATATAPTRPILPTVDPTVSLVTFESPEKGYSIGHPEGWEYRAGSAATADFFVWSIPEGRVLAQLSVSCAPEEDITVDALILRDAGRVADYGIVDSRTAVPIQVSGVEGKQLRYSVSLAELRIEHIVAYAVGGGCGWRIGLNSFGAGTLDPYVPLFERIIESFRIL